MNVTAKTSRRGYRLRVRAPYSYGDNRDYRQELVEREFAAACVGCAFSTETVFVRKHAARRAAAIVENRLEHGFVVIETAT
jgi:hypothetical protein